jgi:hypothetical protein
MELKYKVVCEIKQCLFEDLSLTFTFKVKSFKNVEDVSTPLFKLCKKKGYFEIGKLKFIEARKDELIDLSDNTDCLKDVLDEFKLNFIIEEFYSNPSIYRELLNNYEKIAFKNFGTKMFEYVINYIREFKDSLNSLEFPKSLGCIVAFINGSLYSKHIREEKEKEYSKLSNETLKEKFIEMGLKHEFGSSLFNGVCFTQFENNLLLAEKFYVNKLKFEIINKSDLEEIIGIYKF